VAGRVVADDTGSPLPHARLVIYNDAAPLPAIFSDAEGRFSTAPLPPGRYHLSATKAGYAQTAVPRLNPPASGSLEVRLPRSASLAGRVVDMYGEPVMGMPVSVMDAPGNAIKTVATDDLGDYRVGGLAAGTYLVAINQFSVDSAGNVAREISYYPGMPSAEMAQPLVVAPGDQKSGVDFSGAMLQVGVGKVRTARLGDRIALVRGDATRIPVADASVDAVTMAFGIRNVENVQAACDEMQRVVRPGGRLAILEFAVPTLPGVRTLYLWYFRRVLPLIGRVFSRHQGAYGYLPASVGAFATPAEFVTILRSHGFGDATAVQLTFGIVFLYTARRDERLVAGG